MKDRQGFLGVLESNWRKGGGLLRKQRRRSGEHRQRQLVGGFNWHSSPREKQAPAAERPSALSTGKQNTAG